MKQKYFKHTLTSIHNANKCIDKLQAYANVIIADEINNLLKDLRTIQQLPIIISYDM